MGKNKERKLSTMFRRTTYWHLLIGLIISSIVSVVSLRNNNLQMIKLREDVIKADESGVGVNDALNNLRQYVYSHMNTDLTTGNNAIKPPIQLKNTYEKLVVAEKNRVADANKKVSNDATAICEQQFPAGQLGERVQCVQNYITQNSLKENVVPKELYQFDFVSPVWSRDLAGWSLVLSVGLILSLAFRISLDLWFKRRLE